MADFLISLVQKSVGPNGSPGRFIEIGTRSGDLFNCVSYFAAQGSIAVEASKQHYCPALSSRGIPHICSDFETLKTPETFPEGEVYYYWMWPMEVEPTLRHIIRVEQLRKRKGKGAVVVANFDRQYPADEPLRQGIKKQYGGTWHKVFFDEGDGEREFGVHQPGVFDLEKLVKRADAGWLDEIKDVFVVPPGKNPELFHPNGSMIHP
jgi:hypothetical protein